MFPSIPFDSKFYAMYKILNHINLSDSISSMPPHLISFILLYVFIFPSLSPPSRAPNLVLPILSAVALSKPAQAFVLPSSFPTRDIVSPDLSTLSPYTSPNILHILLLRPLCCHPPEGKFHLEQGFLPVGLIAELPEPGAQ